MDLAAPKRAAPAWLNGRLATMTTSPGCHAAHPGRDCWRTAPGGYCLPPRCYCGACPWWRPIGDGPPNTPAAPTALDLAAIASGKRASGKRRRAAGT